MSETPLALVLLALLTLCAAAMLAVVCNIALELRLTLRQLRTVLPQCDRAARKTCEVLDHGAQLIAGLNRAVKQAERVARATGEAADGIAEQVIVMKNRLRTFLGGHLGRGTNGARGGPRRHS